MFGSQRCQTWSKSTMAIRYSHVNNDVRQRTPGKRINRKSADQWKNTSRSEMFHIKHDFYVYSLHYTWESFAAIECRQVWAYAVGSCIGNSEYEDMLRHENRMWTRHEDQRQEWFSFERRNDRNSLVMKQWNNRSPNSRWCRLVWPR
jgi:hypothetical protein